MRLNVSDNCAAKEPAVDPNAFWDPRHHANYKWQMLKDLFFQIGFNNTNAHKLLDKLEDELRELHAGDDWDSYEPEYIPGKATITDSMAILKKLYPDDAIKKSVYGMNSWLPDGKKAGTLFGLDRVVADPFCPKGVIYIMSPDSLEQVKKALDAPQTITYGKSMADQFNEMAELVNSQIYSKAIGTGPWPDDDDTGDPPSTLPMGGPAAATIKARDNLVEALKAERTGVTCKRCNDHNEFAEPNQSDGTYLCFGCR